MELQNQVDAEYINIGKDLVSILIQVTISKLHEEKAYKLINGKLKLLK